MSNVVIVNDNDEIIGEMKKEEAHQKGILHRIVVVYVVNKKGEILVQNRTDGYIDHSSAGHVEPGETYEQAARRELNEELSIKDVPLKLIGKAKTLNEKYPGKISSHIFNIYVCNAEPGVLQEDEVKSVYWTNPQTILEEMKKDSTKFCAGFVESLKVYLATYPHHIPAE